MEKESRRRKRWRRRGGAGEIEEESEEEGWSSREGLRLWPYFTLPSPKSGLHLF